MRSIAPRRQQAPPVYPELPARAEIGRLTAAVSHVLTGAGISANVVAGYTHDHVFVPLDRADDAMRALATFSC